VTSTTPPRDRQSVNTAFHLHPYRRAVTGDADGDRDDMIQVLGDAPNSPHDLLMFAERRTGEG
jgi:hypothetical protein